MKNTSLIDAIKNSPLVKAAIIEAVHQFYYDRILSESEKDKKDLKETKASDILSTLWNLQPDWRFVLENNIRKYNGNKTPVNPPINSSLLFSKPKKIVPLKLEIEIK